jgi:hypothetical protein
MATAVARKPMSTILFTTCPLLNVLVLFSTYTLLQDGDAEVETKPMSTILFGSTIEFEMAILTMAFLASGDVSPFLSLHTHTCIQRITCMHACDARGRERGFIGDNLITGLSWMDGCKCLDVAPSFFSHPLPFLSLSLSCS